MELCGTQLPDDAPCRRKIAHDRGCNPWPNSPWAFFAQRDANKIRKAGLATPRGGKKGAYQNHVLRNNQVIIPFERLSDVSLADFKDGYVIRLLPEQAFAGKGEINPALQERAPPVVVGENAFVLYRTVAQMEELPPLRDWTPRALQKAGGTPSPRRGANVNDVGHYVLRASDAGKKSVGPPQGIFAPEYATREENYLSQCVLAWLVVCTQDSPYVVDGQADHLRAILQHAGLLDESRFERLGVTRTGITACPLCLELLTHEDLHRTADFSEASALRNAPEQLDGTTRSTVLNLFHLDPMTYHEARHGPKNVAWGHAICNTELGQRKCFSLADLREGGIKIGYLREGSFVSFAFMSSGFEFMRSLTGSVWIRIAKDHHPDQEELE